MCDCNDSKVPLLWTMSFAAENEASKVLKIACHYPRGIGRVDGRAEGAIAVALIQLVGASVESLVGAPSEARYGPIWLSVFP